MAALALDATTSGAMAAASTTSTTSTNSTNCTNRDSPTWEDDYATWRAANSDGSNTNASKNATAAVRNRHQTHRNQRHQHQPMGPGSDSGSSASGKSSGSDSLGSRNLVSLGAANSSIPPPRIPELSGSGNMNAVTAPFGRNGAAMGPTCGGKVNRFKNKRLYPSVPNQPSEASAHFMFELAKTVLLKAGGNSSTSLFTQPINSAQNPRGPIRALQMCAFQIGLYALGLHNCVSAKWLSRTYSSHVSWITGTFNRLFSPLIVDN